jgi:sugar lactone lactonase YvrE
MEPLRNRIQEFSVEPIFELPANLPLHRRTDLQPVAAAIVCEWPKGTFVENLAVLADGSMALSVHSNNAVERVYPGGGQELFLETEMPPAGIVARANGGIYLATGEPGKIPGRVWRVGPEGDAELVITIPDAMFLNGLTPLSETTLLAADSILGRIYRIDLTNDTWSVWFEGDLLRKVTDFPFMPGANGIKTFGGAVYVTNTDQATVVQIAILLDGSAGRAEILAESLRGDDLAFDTAGNAYITTHIENSLVRLSPARERVALAGPQQWMAGSTAAAFGKTAADRRSLYVTTTGGLLRPYEHEVQSAKLVRLDVDAEGALLPFAI